MHPEALILRRCYPVPVTFADLRAAHEHEKRALKDFRISEYYAWHRGLKHVTGAIDEVYAVVDGREVRVAVADGTHEVTWVGERVGADDCGELLDEACRRGYWERPREVRLDLSPRPVTHEEVARAVLVGQEYVERHGQR